MNPLIVRYSQYLNILSQALINQQFKYFAIKRPLPINRKKYIDLLLQANPELIQMRVKYFQKQHIIIPTDIKGNEQLERLSKVRKQQIFEIEESIKQITHQIYSDLSIKFDNFTASEKKSHAQQSKVKKQKPADDNAHLKELIKLNPLQILMNAQTQIILPSQKIKYDHQYSSQQLIDNFFSALKPEEIEKKVKQLEKTMIPQILKHQNTLQTKKQLLILYGIKKEEEFLHNLQDPLQKLLTQKKIDKQVIINLLIRLINLFETRRQYYGITIESLQIQKLQIFLLSTKLLKKTMNIHQLSKHRFLLGIAQNVISNFTFRQLRSNVYKNINSSQIEVYISHFLNIENWLFQILGDFRQFFQGYNCKYDQIFITNDLLRKYNKVKMDRQNFLHQFKTEQLQNRLKQLKRSKKNEKLFVISDQNQQFYYKIIQLVQFSDTKDMTKLKQYLSLYNTLSEIYLKCQQLFDSQPLILKIIDDLSNILEQYAVNPEVTISDPLNQQVIQFIIAFLFKSIKLTNKLTQICFIIKELWEPYLTIHKKFISLTQTQGKYFVMLIHIFSVCSKYDQQINKIIATDQFILQMINREVKMLKQNPQNKTSTTNRNSVIFKLFESEADQLFSQIKQKELFRTILKQFKQLAQS